MRSKFNYSYLGLCFACIQLCQLSSTDMTCRVCAASCSWVRSDAVYNLDDPYLIYAVECQFSLWRLKFDGLSSWFVVFVPIIDISWKSSLFLTTDQWLRDIAALPLVYVHACCVISIISSEYTLNSLFSFADDWKCNQYRWFQNGTKKLPSKNPVVRKVYYVSVTPSGNKQFRRNSCSLLEGSTHLTLIHYMGDEKTATDYPHDFRLN